MRVRSGTQADEAAKASDSANTVISQGELSCDHALSIRGKGSIRLSALNTMPTNDSEAQMILSATDSVVDKQSMRCVAMAASAEYYSTGGFLGIGATPHTKISIKVARIQNNNLPIISSSKRVTIYCLCNNKTYTISGMLSNDTKSFTETITVDGATIDIKDVNQIKFR